MNATISSLALIRAYFDDSDADYLDCFVPFVATYLTKFWEDHVDSTNLTDGLRNEFGLHIPYLAMESIIDKCITGGLLKRENGHLHANKHEANERAFSEDSLRLRRRFGTILHEIQLYAKDYYDLELEEADAEQLILGFLDEYNLDVLAFANKDHPLCSSDTGRDVIIVKDFIQSISTTKPDIFDSIVDIALLRLKLYE